MLRARTAWVFDLDGTLAVAQHDFDAMKARLGLDLGVPLLEGVQALPEPARAEAWAVVSAWELALADHARPAPGLVSLLEALDGRGARLGVLTRNRKDVALRTLRALGVATRFREDDVLGRSCAPPKPDPTGLHGLLKRWDASPSQAVMVGDSIHDVATAKAAGVLGVLVGPGTAEARALASIAVDDLEALLPLMC